MYHKIKLLCVVVVVNGSVATNDVDGVRAWVNYIGFNSKRVFVFTLRLEKIAWYMYYKQNLFLMLMIVYGINCLTINFQSTRID